MINFDKLLSQIKVSSRYTTDPTYEELVGVDLFSQELVNKSLEKAEPKGGKYYRRVTNKSGKHRYYYDSDRYSKSKDAHVDGNEAASKAIKSSVQKFMEVNGDKGCEISHLKGLVKQYGSDVCGKVLDGMKSEGLTFKDGKLYLKKSAWFIANL